MKQSSRPLSARALLRAARALAYYATGHYRRANLGKFVVLMYHRVVPDDDPFIPYIQPGMYVRESSFRQQLEFLNEWYEIVSIQDMLGLIETGAVSPDRQYCVITFDDGWQDNYQYAFPLLKKFSVPATIFLTASFVGTTRAFWHEQVSRLFHAARTRPAHARPPSGATETNGQEVIIELKRHLFSAEPSIRAVDKAIESLKVLPVSRIESIVAELAAELGINLTNERTMLSWNEIQEMGRNGISFGSHTCEHRILTRIDASEAADEVKTSMEKLSTQGLNYVPVFCYPNGLYNDEIQSLVRQAGYAAAVTTKLGRQTAELNDPFAISRIGIHDDIAYNKSQLAFRLR